jgi:hypothetical protein
MNTVALSQIERNIVKRILKDISNVVIFGLRINVFSKRFSDLDICFKDAIAPEVFELLKEAFEKSELPFKVDLVEYLKIPKTFQQIIDQQCIDIRLL